MIAGVSTPDRPLVYELPCFRCRKPFTVSSEDPHFACPTCRGAMKKPTLQKDDVLAALDPDAVLAHYGIRVTQQGRWKRGRACPQRADHAVDAFGISPDGKWHCHACNVGGDLLALVAFAEGISLHTDFGAVLEVAAKIAGVVAGDPPPVRRPPPPPGPTLAERVAEAKKKAGWLWGRCLTESRMVDAWLRSRAIDPDMLRELARVTHDFGTEPEIAYTPIAMRPEEIERSDATRSIARAFRVFGVALPVRSIVDGSIVDVRRRGIDPAWFGDDVPPMAMAADAPKVLGMLGGVVAHQGDLVACYGRPHEVDGTRDVVVVEGWADYLTARLAWTEYDVLGATDAGQFANVAAFAAARVAEAGGEARVVLIAQNDPPRADPKTGQMKEGAATRALDEARVRCLRRLPLDRVPLVLCAPAKDLNDVAQQRGFAACRRLLLEAVDADAVVKPADEWGDWS